MMNQILCLFYRHKLYIKKKKKKACFSIENLNTAYCKYLKQYQSLTRN